MGLQDLKTKFISFIKGSDATATTTATTATNNGGGAAFIPINGNQAEIEGNTDTFRGKTTKSKYDLIKDILCEYRISPQDAEKCGLLENIAGCSREELERMDEESFKTVVKALEGALGITGDWEWFWNDRDIDDINKIIKDANNRYLSQKTGGNWLQQKWFDLTTKSELIKEIQSEGISINNESELDTAIKTYVQNNYFKGLTPEELKNKYSVDEINNFYEKALRGFGNLLIKYNSPEDKAVIVSVIQMLRANQRKLAGNVALQSCQNDPIAKETVAVAIDTNAMYIAGKKDAFGEQMSREDNIELRTQVYDNMGKENREASYARIKTVAEEYQDLIKKEQEGTLTDSEKARLAELKELNAETLYVVGGYTAAKISASKRVENGEPDIITELVNLEKDTTDLGYQDKVNEAVADYVKNNPETLNMTEEEFQKLMDEVNDGNYNQILDDLKNGTTTITTTTDQVAPSNDNVCKKQSQNKSDTDYSSSTDFGYTNLSIVNTNPEVLKNALYNQDRAVESSTTENDNPQTLAEAIKKGGIKEVKEYIKNTNKSFFETTLEILNQDNIAEPIKNWAIARIEGLNDSLIANLCNFITNNDTKMELGNKINSLTALEKINCKNSAVEKYFEKLKQEKEELLT